MGVNINAPRCVEYLRQIGVVVSDADAASWVAQETTHRAQRRAHNRELKKSCGHFRTSWCTIYHEGGRSEVRSCTDCGKSVEEKGASLRASDPRGSA